METSKNASAFIPNGKRYLVLPIRDKGTTTEIAGFKVSTDEDRHKKPSKGTIVAIGDGDLETGYDMKYDTGSLVVFGKFAGIDFEMNGEEYIILAEAEILGEEIPAEQIDEVCNAQALMEEAR